MRLFGFTGGDGVNGSLELELLQYWLYQYRLFIVKLHIDLIAYENWFLDKSCGGFRGIGAASLSRDLPKNLRIYSIFNQLQYSELIKVSLLSQIIPKYKMANSSISSMIVCVLFIEY